MAVIRRNLDAFVERGLTGRDEAGAAFARITVSTRIEDAGGVDHVIEAVPAVRETQLEVFGKLDAVCASDVVLGSTSGQPISLMTARMKHPERAVAMHFIYPAQLIPIVEVCGGPQTAPQVVTWACDVLKAVGQSPALMNKEVAEFLLPDLDTSEAPPGAVAKLVKAGHFGLKSGRGVYDWSTRDGKALLTARAAKLFQHMAEDAKKP